MIISHNMPRVLCLSDRVRVRRAGRLASGGETKKMDGDTLASVITGTRAG